MAWFSGEGKFLGNVGSPNDYYAWSLSPDEKRLAFMEIDLSGAGSSIWIMDLATGASSRLTSGSGPAFTPLWSPDGAEVLFTTGTEQVMSLQRQPPNAHASANVLETEGPKFLSDWSSDGRFVSYFTPITPPG